MGAVVQSPSFQSELGLDKQSTGDILASFFFAYALGQLPAGFLADRFGPRRMITIYILLWSLATALTGFTSTLVSLIAVRALCGLAEAGAYPASGLLISRWFPFSQRARASSIVALGGRIGNSIALWLTALAISAFASWRPVLWTYGAIGILLASLTWLLFRNSPAEHPAVNAAEREFIGTPTIPPARTPLPWRRLVLHPGLWLLNITSIAMNIGWAFIITWLPTYLTEVRGLDAVSASRYVSIALITALAGMLFGGWWCDFLTRRYGQRNGRRLPFITGGIAAALAYLLCPLLPSPAAVAVACGFVAFATDSFLPAVWTIAQDIGGEHVASTMAWSNMWGNFGASAVAKLIPFVLATTLHQPDWSEVFYLCAASFLLVSLAASGIDSTKSLSSQA